MQSASGDGIPVGLVYACEDASEMRPVVIPGPGGQRVVAIIEPGHDPGRMWEELRAFMQREGV